MNPLFRFFIVPSFLVLVSYGFAITDDDADGLESPIGRHTAGISRAHLNGTASILVDRSHGGYFPTLGFLSDLVSRGWNVTEVAEGPITLDLLLQHDILLDCKSYSQWAPDELDAVETYVSVGGGLLVLGDIYSSMTGTNSLAEVFGVHFNPDDMIYDSSNNEHSSSWPTIHILDSHPVTEGIAEFGYYAGLCLEVSEPSKSIARGDEDAHSSLCPVAPTALAVYENMGRAVFYGDTTPFYWSYYPDELDEDEIQLLFNMVNWLTAESVVATENLTWGSVKSRFR